MSYWSLKELLFFTASSSPSYIEHSPRCCISCGMRVM